MEGKVFLCGWWEDVHTALDVIISQMLKKVYKFFKKSLYNGEWMCYNK